jgi:hypothetical protein
MAHPFMETIANGLTERGIATLPYLSAGAALQALVGRLGARATLKLFQDADQWLRVPARTGCKDSESWPNCRMR